MMHCSYQLGQLTTSKKVCVKRRTEAYLEDLTVENLFYCTQKQNLSICRDCPIEKRQTLFCPIDSAMRPLL